MPKTPDPNARRRNARPTWLKLPKAGRPGDPPKFPTARPSQSVLALWAELWATPQAVAWESMGGGTIRVVARYVKKSIEADKAKAPTALLAEVRQLEVHLGLTPKAMQALQWVIDDREIVVGEGAAVQEAGVAHLDDYRDLYGDGTGTG